MENLIEVLCQESDEYEGLLTLSQEKTRIIASADLEKLQKITDDEQEVVSRIAAPLAACSRFISNSTISKAFSNSSLFCSLVRRSSRTEFCNLS